MNLFKQFKPALLVVALVASTVGAGAVRGASVFVDVLVTPRAGGSYDYNLTVRNTGPERVILISFADAPVNDPQIDPSLVSASGFTASYDAGLGFLDLSEDTSLFEPGVPVPGFSFTSGAAPFAAFNVFEAFDENGFASPGQSSVTVIPEPGVPLLGGLVLVSAILRRRRKLRWTA